MNYSKDTFFEMLPDNAGYYVVFWELEPVTPEWEPTGRFTVFYQDRGHARIIYLEMDAEENWSASGDCEGIAQDTIDYVGGTIQDFYA